MHQREWNIQPPVDLPSELLAIVNQDKISAGYLMQRGITSSEQVTKYLNPDQKNLSDPFDLLDMDLAVARVNHALKTGEVIGIWGDFDVDGQTSTAILVECLTKLGANIHYYLPIRGKESHGIALPTLQTFLQKGINLLITCDTGISAHEAVEFANEHHVDVIITDHHTLPEELPPALACINPRRLPEDHAMATLSGSGTSLELMMAVCRHQKQEEIAFQCIDLAALGLIADLAILQKDARLIAQLGLQRMVLQPRAWIQAMMSAANIKSFVMDEQTVGFLIAPRLNAFGRLDDANPLVPFLMDTNPSEIPAMAQKLERLNADRRWLSKQVGQSALELYTRQRELWDDPVVILSHPAWPGGILGLGASQLVSELNRPVILLSESSDGQLRGSARSVDGINITEAITNSSHLLNSYGGHPMAAGLSLPVESLPEFRRSMNNWVRESGLAVVTPPPLEIDAEISIPFISADMFSNLQRLAPFGNGNPAPVFCARSVHITASNALGRSKEHYRFSVEDQSGNSIPAVWWGADSEHIPAGWFDLAFTVRENHYQGESTLQAEWIDFHLLEDTEIRLPTSMGLPILDFRSAANPLESAIDKLTGKNYLIYQEPPPLEQDVASGRNHLSPIDTLILASAPPSMSVLEKVIRATCPQKVILAFDTPGQTSSPGFLKQLSGFILYAVTHRNGLANLRELAEASTAREETVEAGIAWLESAGKIRVAARENDLLEFIIENHQENLMEKKELEIKIDYLLKETRAFQKHLYSLPVEDFNDLLSGFLKPSISKSKITKLHMK